MRRTLALVSACLLASSLTLHAQTVGGFMRLPGMRAGGAITRDVNGIPVIWALSDYDLYFLQGWIHAEDRLFQMDVTRRQASGTLAELLGSAALPSDVQFRAIGIRRAATAAANVISAQTALDLDAYAAGVNAWVASHALPPEYAALELTTFAPWSALDTLTVAKGLAYNLSLDTSDIDRTVALLTYQGIGAAAGFDGSKLFFQDLYRTSPFDPATTIKSGAEAPDEGGVGAGETGTQAFAEGLAARSRELVENGTLELARAYLDRVAAIPPDLGPFLQAGADKGSNEWAIAGKNTASGVPILANDPHLSLGTPSTLYPISLRAGSMNVTGYGFAGAPYVILGFNDRIAWGATVNYMDVTDIYQETVVPDATSASGLATIYKGNKEPITPVPEVFRANKPGNGTPNDVAVVPAGTAYPGGTIPAASLVVPRRNSGPIIQITLPTADKPQGSALSVAYTGSGPTRELEAFLAFDKARNLDDFKKGLTLFDVGSQNFAYADVDGNIAYFTSAEMPVREDLQAEKVSGLPPYFLRSGAGGNEWAPRVNSYPGQALNYEILAPSEMPSATNPEFFVNGNNDPIGTNSDNDALNQKRPGGGIYYLNAYTYDSFRGARITQLINQKLSSGTKKISFADVQQIQGDAVLIDAQVFVPYLLKAAQNAAVQGAHPVLAGLGASPVVAAAIARLQAWDFSTPTGIPEGYDASDVGGKLSAPTQAEIDASVAATIYAFFRSRLIANTVDAVLGQFPVSAPLPDSGRTLVALRNLLDNYATGKGIGASGVPFFNTPGVTATQEERRDIILLKSLADGITLASSDTFAAAFAKSTNLSDYRWGKLHRIVFAHPLGEPFSTPPANGRFPAPLAGLTGIPKQGGFGVVDASSHSVRAATLNGFMFGSGPTRRFVAEMTKGAVKVESSLPGGVSGSPASPFYVNLLPMWLTNETFPMSVQTGPTLPWIKY